MTKAQFLRSVNNPLKISLFMLGRLPGAWFMGVRVRSCDEARAVISLPYRWRSQNPFRSVYFAAQLAAGEFSSGILAQVHLQGRPPVSMLVTHVEADFVKKAGGDLLFTCENGRDIEAAIERTLSDGAPQTLVATAIGTLPDGTMASRIQLTWSFRRKG